MAGFENDVLLCSNVNFNPGLPKPHTGLMTTDGQLIIGSSALNAGGTHLNIGVLTSPLGTITIGYNSPNITLDVPGGTPYVSLTPYIVGSDVHSGYSTIGAALAAAPASSIIFIKAGTYTEDLAVTKNVTLVGFGVAGQAFFAGAVELIGQMTISTGAIVGVTGIDIRNTGGNASFNITNNCTLICQNCVFTPASASLFLINNSSAHVLINNCECNSSATVGLFTNTAGNLWIKDCSFTAGASGAASTVASGTVQISNSLVNFPITTSSTGTIYADSVQFGNFFASLANQTYVTTAGSGSSYLASCTITSGTSSAVSIGVGTTLTMVHTDLNSSNTNVLTGAGTLQYALLSFSGSSSGHNVTTETALPTLL